MSRPRLAIKALVVPLLMLASPAHSQTRTEAQSEAPPPSQAQLDAWAVEVIRYCAPEIRQMTTVFDVILRRSMQRQGVSKAEQDQYLRSNAQTLREGRERILAQIVSWAVAPPDYIPDLEDVYRRPLGVNRDGHPEELADQATELRARRDVQFCMRARATELEFPGYKRW